MVSNSHFITSDTKLKIFFEIDKSVKYRPRPPLFDTAQIAEIYTRTSNVLSFEVETSCIDLFQHYCPPTPTPPPNFYLVSTKINCCGIPLRLRTTDSGLYAFFLLSQKITFWEIKVYQMSYIFRE